MNIKLFSILALVLLFSVLSLSITSAQSSATIDLSSLTLAPGESGVIQARIDCGSEQCSLFDITIEFDPTIIQVDGMEIDEYLGDIAQGQVLIVSNIVNNASGTLRLAAVSIGTPPELTTHESYPLFQIQITALNSGETALTISNLAIGDLMGNPLNTLGVSGLVVVTAAATEEPTAHPTSTLRPIAVQTDGATEEPADMTLLEALEAERDFTVFFGYLRSTGLLNTLEGNGPYTIFAPTNEAIAAALRELGLTAAQIRLDPERLLAIIQYHIVEGKIDLADLEDGDTLETLLEGTEITVSVDDTIMLNDTATVEETEIRGSNGVVYTVDMLLLPLTPA